MHTQRGLSGGSPIGITVVVGKGNTQRVAQLDLTMPTEDIDAVLAFIRQEECGGINLPLYSLGSGSWGIGERWTGKGTLARVAMGA